MKKQHIAQLIITYNQVCQGEIHDQGYNDTSAAF